MIDFSVRGVRINLMFGFFAVVAIASIGRSDCVMIALLCCCAHETGHLLAMLCFRQKPNAIVAYGGGIRIKAPLLRVSAWREAVIYLCGPIVNLLLYIVSCVIGISESSFALANLSLCLFNLLPAKNLDGGKIAKTLAENSRLCYNVFAIARISVLAVLAAIAFMLLMNGCLSITLLVAVAYMLINECIG